MSTNVEKLKPTIGQRLKRARSHAGVSQKPIVKALHTTVQTVSKWENDHVEKIAPEVFKVYSDISGFTMDYLQGFVDDPHETAFDKTKHRIGSKLAISFEFISIASDYRLRMIDDDSNEAEILKYNHETKQAEPLIPGQRLIMDQRDLYVLIDIVNRCVEGTVSSYIENIALPNLTGEKTYMTKEDYFRRYDVE